MVSWWDFDLKFYNSVYKLHLWRNTVVTESELCSSMHESAVIDIDILAQCKLACKFKGFFLGFAAGRICQNGWNYWNMDGG